MKKLYFVRHGLTAANVDGIWSGRLETPLTDEGRRQARATGEALKAHHEPIDLIIASSMERTMETARLIATELDYPLDKIITSELFVERGFGELEGTPSEAFFESHEYQHLDDVAGAETIERMHARAERAFRFIQKQAAHNILIVSHGSFGRALRRIVNQQPHTAEYEGERFHIQNAEIVELI